MRINLGNNIDCLELALCKHKVLLLLLVLNEIVFVKSLAKSQIYVKYSRNVIYHDHDLIVIIIIINITLI